MAIFWIMSIRFNFRCESVCHHCSSLTIIFSEPEWTFFWNKFKCTFEKLKVAGKAKFPPAQTDSNLRSTNESLCMCCDRNSRKGSVSYNSANQIRLTGVNFACVQSGNRIEPRLLSLQVLPNYGPEPVICS